MSLSCDMKMYPVNMSMRNVLLWHFSMLVTDALSGHVLGIIDACQGTC